MGVARRREPVAGRAGLPPRGDSGDLLGMDIAVADVSANRRLQRELQHSHEELETAYEELQSTNEELETTNQELQSTVEELETTNEELLSTNEELETMNEELQSTNEELQTINDELRQRSDDLHSANAFLGSVLGSLRSGVAVFDRDLTVLSWNSPAQDLWGLRADEVLGHHLFNLEIGLPVERLRPLLRACVPACLRACVPACLREWRGRGRRPAARRGQPARTTHPVRPGLRPAA